MRPEQVIQLILWGAAAIFAGWGLYVERQKQNVKREGVQTEAQRLLNVYAEGSQQRERVLSQRIEHLEAIVKTLQEQLDLFVGGSAYAEEGNRASFRG